MSRLLAILLSCLAYWMQPAAALELSPEEEAWLAENHRIRLGIDASWPPFEFRDANGRYSGLSAGYVQLIEERLKLSLTPVEPKNWSEVLASARSGKLDLLPGVMSTPERQRDLIFTRPYLDFPIVILAHRDGPQPSNMQDLYGLKIAVVKDYAPTNCCATATRTSVCCPCPVSMPRYRRWLPAKPTPWSATSPPASGACAS